MRIAILTRQDFKSPRILAESLQAQLLNEGVEASVFFEIDILTRLDFKASRVKVKLHYWVYKKIVNYFPDKKLLRKLKNFDAIIVSECSPNGFWKNHYHIEKFKKLIKRPLLFYEVYYIGNAPTQIKKLEQANDPVFERYDWHLAVTGITEIRQKPKAPWSAIGLYSKAWNLKPIPRKDFFAIVDFMQSGYEEHRESQIRALEKAGVKYISLEKKYSISEIRSIYQEASIFFVQFPEAFGLPILECLCSGTQIFTPDSAWPMSWRLDENPKVHEGGKLPACFTVYSDEDDLLNKIIRYKEDFNKSETPKKVFESFIQNYPSLYYGSPEQLSNILNRLKENRLY